MAAPHLQHKLRTRHILMIALGSAIGTGFFFGSGESIRLAGPAILLAYLIGGIMMYIIVRALGEMAVAEPSSGSFSFYAYKYIGSYAGFVAGWNYWFNYIIVCMLELTASSLFLDYWFPNSWHWLITLVILLLFTGINLLAVRFFGEFEFWFAGIKVITVIALLLFGLYILGFQQQRNHSISNIANLWQNGGFFGHGLYGFLCSFVIVVFSFGGTELIGITAGEAEQPQKTIPLAINGIIVRILLFYIATLAMVMCLYPWNKIDVHLSPFVDVFKQIGISQAADLMNIVAITAALSSLNSGIYGTARMAYNLAQQGNAPRALGRINPRTGTPRTAILFSITCIMLTIILNYWYPQTIFKLLLAIATIAAIINWLTILLTHACFKHQTKQASAYPSLFYPFSSIIAGLFLLGAAVIMYFIPDMRLAIVIAPLWLLLLSCGYFIHKRFMSI